MCRWFFSGKKGGSSFFFFFRLAPDIGVTIRYRSGKAKYLTIKRTDKDYLDCVKNQIKLGTSGQDGNIEILGNASKRSLLRFIAPYAVYQHMDIQRAIRLRE